MNTEIQMNIDQAVRHLRYRLTPKDGKRIAPDQKDVEAFNFVLNTLNAKFDAAVNNDRMLTKLVLEKLMMLTMSGGRTMKHATTIVKEILDTPLDDWQTNFIRMVPMARLTRALEQEFIAVRLTADQLKNAKLVRETKNKLMTENSRKYQEEFTKPYTEADLKIFLARFISELKTDFQNKP